MIVAMFLCTKQWAGCRATRVGDQEFVSANVYSDGCVSCRLQSGHHISDRIVRYERQLDSWVGSSRLVVRFVQLSFDCLLY